ncbi:hypothetical protein NN561_008392 [Cricetulus griseus]
MWTLGPAAPDASAPGLGPRCSWAVLLIPARRKLARALPPPPRWECAGVRPPVLALPAVGPAGALVFQREFRLLLATPASRSQLV